MSHRIAQQVESSPVNREMAVRVLREEGVRAGSMLQFTARHMTAPEIEAALTQRGWTWDDILRANA